MGDFIPVLESLSAKNVFYVIRRGYKNRYLSAAPYAPYRETLQEAQRFDTVQEALCRVHTMGGVEMSTEIVRVEEHTTVGTKRRIEVPLGDKRQIGVAIRAQQHVVCYANLQRKVDGGWLWNSNGDAIENAQVFSSVNDLLQAVARLSRKSAGVADNISGSIVGIAEETTPGTTKYTETVLA